jgi:hypothetical protein
MIASMYVTSTQTLSGKSTLCAGLLHRMQRDGFKVGYMKPVSTTAGLSGGRVVDEDARFMKAHFDLTDPLETVVPVDLSGHEIVRIISGGEADFAPRIKEAFEGIAQGRDVVVLEGAGSLREGRAVNLAPQHLSGLLESKVLVVVPYVNDLQLVDDLVTASESFGEALLGGVVNSVPGSRVDFVKGEAKAFLERRSVRLFAVVPRERALLSVSVRELAEGVQGEVLCCEQGLEELVEHMVVGAMGAEAALAYFRRKPRKAVITGGDRPDIQMVALETSTRCLILTGNIRPVSSVVSRAEDQSVPIILTRHDTMSAIEQIDDFFGRTRFHQKHKLERLDQLLEEQMDFQSLYEGLGLPLPGKT